MISFDALKCALQEDHAADIIRLELNQTEEMSSDANNTSPSLEICCPQKEYTYQMFQTDNAVCFHKQVSQSFTFQREHVRLQSRRYQVHVDAHYTILGKHVCAINAEALSQPSKKRKAGQNSTAALSEYVEYPVIVCNKSLKSLPKTTGMFSLKSTFRIQKARLFFCCDAMNVSMGILVGRLQDGSAAQVLVDWSKEAIEKEDDACFYKEAANWAHRVRDDGQAMRLDLPSCKELFPNMRVVSDAPHIQARKKEMALRLGELTLMRGVDIHARRKAHMQGVYRIDDPTLNASLMGLEKTKQRQVDEILRARNAAVVKVEFNRLPSCNDADGFFDFETLGSDLCRSLFPNIKGCNDYLFMIGIAIKNEHFACFVVDALTMEEERRILLEFLKFCVTHNISRLFHWASHEIKVLKQLNERHGIDALSPFQFVDMERVFETKPWCPKGAMSFSLKEFAPNMYKHGMIRIIWDSDCTNGEDAMWQGYKAIQGQQSDILKDIVAYNRVDVVSMMQIWQYTSAIGISFESKCVNVDS